MMYLIWRLTRHVDKIGVISRSSLERAQPIKSAQEYISAMSILEGVQDKYKDLLLSKRNEIKRVMKPAKKSDMWLDFWPEEPTEAVTVWSESEKASLPSHRLCMRMSF